MIRVVRARPVLAMLTLLIVVTGVFVQAGRSSAAAGIPEPHEDAFYQPPGGFEAKAPGTILRSRPVTVRALGIPVPVRSWQLLTRSTDAKGRPVAVVATLVVPYGFFIGPRPLLSYQTAIDSLGDQCQPSYNLRLGTEKEEALIAMGLLKGWAVVITDFEGPRNAFAAGRMAGHGVLDGIRAAEQLAGTGLSGTKTPVGMWGYSGGGQATTWAAELQPSYAPELNVKGVAAGGVPGDLVPTQHLDGGPFSGLFITAAIGISREYPEITTVLNDRGKQLAKDAADTCVIDASVLFSFKTLSDYTTVPEPLKDPVVAGVLEDNKLGKAAPTAPIYLFHSFFDELIPVQVGRDLRTAYCQKGGKVQYHEDYVSEHISLDITWAPQAVSYLDARFKGVPAPTNCPA